MAPTTVGRSLPTVPYQLRVIGTAGFAEGIGEYRHQGAEVAGVVGLLSKGEDGRRPEGRVEAGRGEGIAEDAAQSTHLVLVPGFRINFPLLVAFLSIGQSRT